MIILRLPFADGETVYFTQAAFTNHKSHFTITEGDVDFSSAVDFGMNAKTQIIAPYDGEVVSVYYGSTKNEPDKANRSDYGPNGLGNIVTLKHVGPDGVFYSTYAHLHETSTQLAIGQKVKAGETVLGLVGNTGASDGDHLHFQINQEVAGLKTDNRPWGDKLKQPDIQYVKGGDPNYSVDEDGNTKGDPKKTWIYQNVVWRHSEGDLKTPIATTVLPDAFLAADPGPVFTGANDVFTLPISTDAWFAYSGDDTVYGSKKGDKISGQSGNDSLHGNGGRDTLSGGSENDTIRGGAGHDRIHGEDGHDSLIGGTEKDTIDGGADNDSIYGNRGRDSLQGGSGLDTIFGGDGRDKLFGGAGVDHLIGESGNDTLRGGEDWDYLYGGPGGDVLIGGPGRDAASYIFDSQNGGDQPIDADLEASTVIDPWGDIDSLRQIENLQGTPYDDTLRGSADNDHFHGFAGNDLIVGREGGQDRVHYDQDHRWGGTEGITANLQRGRVTDTFGDRDSLRSIEAITGSAFDDVIRGRKDWSWIYGSDGNDTLYGGSGSGGMGGGRGADHLYGQAGNDYFVFFSPDDSPRGAGDTIFDFEPGDWLRFSEDLAWVTYVGNAPFSGAPGEIRFVTKGDDVLFRGNLDNTPGFDFQVVLDGAAAMTEFTVEMV